MTALLASVRTVQEAEVALRSGADVIDLKDPRAGALGALSLPVIEAIVACVRVLSDAPISATIGDLPADAIEEVTRRVLRTAASGVDFVKVGIAPGAHAGATLEALAALPARVVPLFLADHGIDFALIERACAAGFPFVMVDTADKRRGSLFDCVAFARLQRMVEIVRAGGARAGIAGSLRVEHVPFVHELAPAIAGFRGALCDEDRTGTLAGEKVRALRDVLPALRAEDLDVGALRSS